MTAPEETDEWVMLREVDSLEQAIQMDDRDEVHFLVFSTVGKSQDLSGWFEAIIQYIPCDPTFYGRSWDAALDSMAGGISNLHARNISIYWLGAKRFAASNPNLYAEIEDDFNSMVKDISKPEIMSSYAKNLVIYFGP